jgi:hypothetical protein
MCGCGLVATCEPGRRDAGKDAAGNFSMGRRAQAAEGLHDGVILFLAADALDALAASDDCSLRGIDMAAEGINEDGFADARFARDKDNAPLAKGQWQQLCGEEG